MNRRRRAAGRGAWRRWLAGVLLAALGVAAGVLVVWLWPEPLRPEADAMVADVPRDSVVVAERRNGGHHLVIEPVDGGVETLFVLYPGGLVRPHAYVWLGVALAPYRVRTVIPVMPADLAVLAPGRAGALVEAYPDARRVVLGGHSLGGAMAARFAANEPSPVDGLVLMGAFTADGDDLSDEDLPTLVLAAEHDGLATLAEIRDGMPRLPDDARLVVVDGAVHAFFGRYGPQRGDGVPTTTRAAAEAAIRESLRSFLETVVSEFAPP